MIDISNFTLTVLALEELKQLGYKEVWIGRCDCPHWKHMGIGDIVASPKIADRCGWPAIWRVSEKLFGKSGCGNGLKDADQTQRSCNFINGYYKLIDDNWETEVFKSKGVS
jgi:hypothetical protein